MIAALRDLVCWARASDIVLHTVEVSRGGRLLASAALAPFGPRVPHRMYSVSKSVTALAVLLLAEEGRLHLTDPIVRHFPEMAPVHPWLAATTIDDMLAMTGPHSRTTYVEGDGGWLQSYFRVPPTHRAGTLFTYDTSASYVLSALVERLTGARMLDWLRPRLLEPLGIGDGARFCTGPEAISHGGSGLIAAPRDLLRLAELINADGCADGRRLIPSGVVARLIEQRSDAGTQTWGAPLRAGYGRQTWLPADGTWMMFGLGGQLVIGQPGRSLAAVVTADATSLTGGDQRLVEKVLRALDGIADERTVAARGSVAGVGSVVGAGSAGGAGSPAGVDAVLPAPGPSHVRAHARQISGVFRIVTGEGAPAELTVAADADTVRLQWPGSGALTFSTARPAVGHLGLGDAVTTAAWSAPGVLELRISAHADDIASVRLRLVVDDDGGLTVMSQGFGPAIDQSWTWRGSYAL